MTWVVASVPSVPLQGEWIAADEFRCSAPAHVPDFADFNVGIKNDFAVQELSQPTIYEYAVTPTMTTVMDNEDGTVSVIGTGFQPGAKVYCNLEWTSVSCPARSRTATPSCATFRTIWRGTSIPQTR